MSGKSEAIVLERFEAAGITINGSAPHDIQVHDPRFYRRLIRDGALGFGESYMEAWWDCEDLFEALTKILTANLGKKFRGNWLTTAHFLKARLFNLQLVSRAFIVGEQHYDIGNDLYRAMLDKRMVYSCAYWSQADNLDDAQVAKLELICHKLALEPGMTLLDIGCGWGALAKYAAENYGAKVVGITVSRNQLELGRELCHGLPVEIRLEDYRSVSGTFDRVVSVGFFEHVGYKNYRTYMDITARSLKTDGIALLHTIGRNASTSTIDRWTHKYIFPNSLLPSIAQIGRALEYRFIMEDWQNFAPDYERTLHAWYENFQAAWGTLGANYDERFRRMWKFYLRGAAAGFRARTQQLWQIVLTKPGRAHPETRAVP